MGKILLVEDEEDIQMVITKRLTDGGHEVTPAGDGQKGLDRLKDFKPDLIITDILMPNMDGFQLFKELKRKEETRDIPVLVISARGKMADTFIAIGANHFVPKPFKTEELLAKVEALLNGTTPVWPPPSTEPKEEKPEEAKPETEEKSEEKKEEAPEGQKTPVPKGKFGGKTFVVAGYPGEGIDKIAQMLRQEGAAVQTVTKGDDVQPLVEKAKADVLLLNVLMQNPDAAQIASKVRKSDKKVFIMLYSHQEKDSHEGMTIPKVTALADKAKKDCIEAGSNHTIGQFTPEVFIKNLSEKLP